MFDAEKLDAVDIITQQGAHRALAELAISRRVAAIVQKPFCADLGRLCRNRRRCNQSAHVAGGS